MSLYPSKIHDRVLRPENAGAVALPDAAGTEASFVCGSFVSVTLKIDRERAEILDARYRTNGCGYLIAASEIFTKSLIKRDLRHLHGTHSSEVISEIAAELGHFPAGRSHCSMLVVDAVRAALANYRQNLVDEYRGERALICTCFGIDEDAIETCIRQNGLAEVEEVVEHCRAGGGCGSCQPIIQEMLDSIQR